MTNDDLKTEVAFAALHTAVHCALTLREAGLLQKQHAQSLAERLRELADLMDAAPGYEERSPHLAVDLHRAAHNLGQEPHC